jgi:hypothetical protein
MAADQDTPTGDDRQEALDRRRPRSSFVERIGKARGRRAGDRGYAFESSEGLVESMLGRQLIPDAEHALMTAARQWLAENGCPREANAGGRGRYLVPDELARRFPTECWPKIKHLAHG